MPDKSEQQKDAEAEVEGFQHDLGPFVVAAETTRMAMVFTDAKEPGNPIIFANDAFLALTGYAREEVLGQSFNFLMADGTNAAALKRIEVEFEANSQAESSKPIRRPIRKSSTGAKMAANSGPAFWPTPFATRAAPSSSILPPSSI